MPLLGAQTAPAKFKGKHNLVKRFIRQYKQMCAIYNVLGKERCKWIIDYCSSVVTQFIESLDSFMDGNWNQLEEDILTYYDADLSKQERIHNLKKFKQYEVDFLMVSNWLLCKKKITKNEQHTKFWYGLNNKLCEAVEAHHLTMHPQYDPWQVIVHNDVVKIIYNIFT
ncbi:uncharacterized protein EV420DRAFT_1260757 [Desarmillaria tabescens]|uniref:Uncharacterized protein n=1 Tax=Armillaria tabescens TaxID=1929756 RepID=A0AA39NKI5_ARMTA|nr:uncharacterized protein EV420DRAFT_1260757 [Desarmillaria tabescens]KAK0467349.1 hypothetical protein EV420DRAFT_1260757 [Desarmillaria tabescens]